MDTSLPELLDDGTRYYDYGLDLLYLVNPRGFSAPAAAKPNATATSTPHAATAPGAATTPKGVSTTSPDNVLTHVRVYHLDGPGSVRALTDEYGTLTNTYSTDAFGANAQQQGLNPQPFGYTGQQVDNDGLVYLRARYYDPNTGRFMSRDPMAGAAALPLSLNRYTYVQNTPGLNADPSGLAGSNNPFRDDSDTCLDPSSHELCIGPIRIPLPGGLSVLGINLFHGQDSGGSDRANGDRPTNRTGMRYPSWLDPRTGKEVPFPTGDLKVIDPAKRAQWDAKARASFIATWREKGYDLPEGGWAKYDIHHITPREYGGTNDFWNLVPVEKEFHKNFNRFWENY